MGMAGTMEEQDFAEPAAPAYDFIIRSLTEGRAAFTIHEHPAATTVADAEARLPFPPAQFLKTVVFRVRGGDWVLVALRGADQVDYRKLAAALGVKRGDLFRAAPEEVEAALGFQIGGVSPIPPTGNARAIFDDGTRVLDIVYCGSGRNDRTLEARLSDLLRVAHGQVWPVVRDPG